MKVYKIKTAKLHTAVTLPGTGIEGDFTLQPLTKHKGVALEYDDLGLWVIKGERMFLVPHAGVQSLEIDTSSVKIEVAKIK